MVNLFIVYKSDVWSRALNMKFTLGHCFFGAVKLTNNAEPGQFGYSGYGPRFNLHSQFLLPIGKRGKCYFWCRQSVHADNRNRI